MTQLHETIYPRIRSTITEKELKEIYTPTHEEIAFASRYARKPTLRLRLLVMLKVFQRLGYFPRLSEVPQQIIEHITRSAGFHEGIVLPADASTRPFWRHNSLIRKFLDIESYTKGGAQVMENVLLNTSRSKDVIADIINVGIEELIRQRYELPAFTTLRRAAREARSITNKDFYKQVSAVLPDGDKRTIESLLARTDEEPKSLWNQLKEEAKPPTTKTMREFIQHLRWLQGLGIEPCAFEGIPEAKVERFAGEAKAFDMNRMNELASDKRVTLAAALICAQRAQALDDLAEMYTRTVRKLLKSGKEALEQYRIEHQDRTDALIERLSQIVEVWEKERESQERLEGVNEVIGDDLAELRKQCDEHLVCVNNNIIPFLSSPYKSKRANFFRFLETVSLKTTTSDTILEEAIAFLLRHKKAKQERISVGTTGKNTQGEESYRPLLELSWIPERWWKGVTGKARRSAKVQTVDRRSFELCMFSCVMFALNSGDLYIEGSNKFNDYRKQLISWEEYESEIDLFCEQVGFSRNPANFVGALRSELEETIKSVDESFPTNEDISIKKGKFVLRKVTKQPEPEGFQDIDKLLTKRMPEIDILDLLVDTEHWLRWTSRFGPLSGFEAKLQSPQERYLATTFCYGCYLGPAQTSRSLDRFERRQLSYVNQKHVTEDNIQEVIVDVINQYNRFELIKCWGSGDSAAADGMKWDLYEQNLLSEYHVRYGGWGGVGYYHVSDTYIALFSNFVSCGVWEGIHILDIFEHQSEIRPETLHADTQGQSLPIFGLAYLLGIQLMPRIRKWKDLNLYLPDMSFEVCNIKDLFTNEPIDWELVLKHLPDMLRVALSISKGRITPSTILRKLGTYSRKNKLYLAFRELGRVVRTSFLLKYISDLELRRTISAATNKNESFNDFAQWIGFGQNGKIPGRNREEQQKAIRYNHLMANLLIFHNTVMLTNLIEELRVEGHAVTEEIIARLSPYRREHINRLGTYKLRLERESPPLPICFSIS